MIERESGSASEHLELGSGRPLPRPARTKGGGRRKLVAGVGALAVLGAGVGAVWAWQAFLVRGAQPAEALPASTLAYVAVDLDPAAGQKLAALGFLRKFPSLEKHVGVTDAGDLRKDAFDGLESDLGCGLSYADVEPWVGERFAFAVVDQGGPKPVAVLQVADHELAAAGLKRLTECADGELGSALGDEWAVLAETKKVADGVLRDAAQTPLTDDAEFQHWTGEAGEPGVVTLYAAPEAGPALISASENNPYLFLPSEVDPLSMMVGMVSFAVPGAGGYGSDVAYATETSSEVRAGKPRVVRRGGQKQPMPQPPSNAELKKLENMTPAEQDKYFQKQFNDVENLDTMTPAELEELETIDPVEEEWTGFPEPAIPAEFRSALMNFSGLGGVVRFDDGALELELVSDRIEGTMGNLVAGTAGDDVLAQLPADSAAAFGAGFRDGWGAAFVERFAESASPFGTDPQTDAVAEFEKHTGLTVGDLESLGGDSFAFVAGSGLNPEAVFYEDPTGMKVAARISGGADGVEAALAKVRARMPQRDQSLLHWRRVGDDVLVGGNPAYLDELATSGDLAGADPFTDAVPDAADAASVFYLNFDSGDWLAGAVDKSDRPDAEPLAAVGYSLHDEGDRERTVLRVTTED